MDQKTEQYEELEQSLAEGIASIMAADQALEDIDDLTLLYLEELNRLWAEPQPLPAI